MTSENAAPAEIPLNDRALQAAVIEGSNIADEYLVRKILAAYLGALPGGPAEMPGEMEVARAIATFRKHLYPDTKIDVLPSELAQAAAVMTLFAPILAEKEQVSALMCDDCGWAMRFPDLGCVHCGFHRAEARALAAEANFKTVAQENQDLIDKLEAAEDALAELRKQMLADEGQHREAVAAERVDADRYRHLRDNFVRERHMGRLLWYLPTRYPLTADALDESIDRNIAAAIRAQGE